MEKFGLGQRPGGVVFIACVAVGLAAFNWSAQGWSVVALLFAALGYAVGLIVMWARVPVWFRVLAAVGMTAGAVVALFFAVFDLNKGVVSPAGAYFMGCMWAALAAAGCALEDWQEKRKNKAAA